MNYLMLVAVVHAAYESFREVDDDTDNEFGRLVEGYLELNQQGYILTPLHYVGLEAPRTHVVSWEYDERGIGGLTHELPYLEGILHKCSIEEPDVLYFTGPERRRIPYYMLPCHAMDGNSGLYKVHFGCKAPWVKLFGSAPPLKNPSPLYQPGPGDYAIFSCPPGKLLGSGLSGPGYVVAFSSDEVEVADEAEDADEEEEEETQALPQETRRRSSALPSFIHSSFPGANSALSRHRSPRSSRPFPHQSSRRSHVPERIQSSSGQSPGVFYLPSFPNQPFAHAHQRNQIPQSPERGGGVHPSSSGGRTQSSTVKSSERLHRPPPSSTRRIGGGPANNRGKVPN